MKRIEIIQAKAKLPTSDCSVKGWIDDLLQFALEHLIDVKTGAVVAIQWKVFGFRIPKIGKIIAIAVFTVKLIEKIVKCINND